MRDQKRTHFPPTRRSNDCLLIAPLLTRWFPQRGHAQPTGCWRRCDGGLFRQGGPFGPSSFSTRGRLPHLIRCVPTGLLSQMDKPNMYRNCRAKRRLASPLKCRSVFSQPLGYPAGTKAGGAQKSQRKPTFAAVWVTPIYATCRGRSSTPHGRLELGIGRVG